jgi:hypothetical protein
MEPAQTFPGITDASPQVSDFSIHGDHAALFGALAKAQADFKAIVRSKEVHVRSDKGNYSFLYAPLEEVLAATVPALSANELVILQPLGHANDGDLVLRTVLAHSSGARIETRMTLPQTTTGYGKDGARFERQKTAQEIGSAITYMRRYMVQSLLGVNAEEDDDGAQGEDMPRTLTDNKKGPHGNARPTPPPVERKAAPQSKPEQPKLAVAPPPTPPQEPAQEPKAEAAPEPAPEPERPASVPPPANDTAPDPNELVEKGSPLHVELRGMLAKLGFDPKMTESWCLSLLGKSPLQVKTRSDYETLLADLKRRESA